MIETLEQKIDSLKLYPVSEIMDAIEIARGRDEIDRWIKKRNKRKSDPGIGKIKRREWPDSVKWAKAKAQRGMCLRCKKPLDTPVTDNVLDHIVPLAKGGQDIKSNLCLIHGKETDDHPNCNAEKGANDVFQESKRTGQMVTEILGRGGDAMRGDEDLI